MHEYAHPAEGVIAAVEVYNCIVTIHTPTYKPGVHVVQPEYCVHYFAQDFGLISSHFGIISVMTQFKFDSASSTCLDFQSKITLHVAGY